MSDKERNQKFIETRLKSLNEIDYNVASLLDNMSVVFDKYANPNNDYEQTKSVITDQTKIIYQTISDIAIKLRKEVKIMDENIGVYDRNKDGVMILPIPVDQKNTALGKKRLNEELEQLKKLIPEEPSDEQKVRVEDVVDVKSEDLKKKDDGNNVNNDQDISMMEVSPKNGSSVKDSPMKDSPMKDSPMRDSLKEDSPQSDTPTNNKFISSEDEDIPISQEASRAKQSKESKEPEIIDIEMEDI